jgi:hypothetical protein
MDNSDLKDPKTLSPWWLAVALIAIVVVCSGYWLVVSRFINNHNDQGTFGDMFGALNALFSGCAFAGVIYAIFVQRSELRFAKTELAHTKRIFEEQSASLALQNEETRRQIFENIFFQMLRIFTDAASSIDVEDGKNTYVGKDALRSIERDIIEPSFNSPEIPEDGFLERYEQKYEEYQNDLGHYFRTLYAILKFIKYSDTQDKKFYTNIVRAQVSNSELQILLYNGLSRWGVIKMKPLLEEFSFFDNLPFKNVKFKLALAEYGRAAFGENSEILTYWDANQA